MSKGLEALKYLKENKRKHWLDGDNSNECLEIIEKELKALEIIKSKPVSTNWFVFYKDYDEYYLDCEYADTSKRLTEEEYDLLKEVLL